MALRIKELQSIVNRTMNEETYIEKLRVEVTRVLGSSVLVEGNLTRVATEANDRIEVLERTGRARSLAFNPRIMSKLIESSSAEARKLAARTLPVNMLGKLMNDKNSGVRVFVAKRVPLRVVKEMLIKTPNDDAIREVYRAKKLEEAGLPKPKVQEDEFDYHGEERLGDSVKQHEGPELSDVFYDTLAHKIIQDYGGNLEGQWEEMAVHRYVSSMKATSHVDIDEEKLYKAVKDKLEEKEERALERTSLKELARRLRVESDDEFLLEGHNIDLLESNDPVEELLESNLSMNEFVESVNIMFRVKESSMPTAIKKYRVSEGIGTMQNVPCVATLPHNHGFRPVDERVLDTYCKHWNSRQAMSGEPLRLEWSTHPDAMGKVSFNVTLR